MLLFLLLGCTHSAPPMVGYFGPTLTLDQLVARVNDNNRKVATLWAHVHFAGDIVDQAKKKSGHIDGFGTLLYSEPNRLRLKAQNEFADFLDMGSSGKDFWLYEPHEQVMWWGDIAAMAQMESADFPIRPDLVMEILGVRPVDESLLREPVPTVRFNNVSDAYMVDWNTNAWDHWAVVKEIWYDRQTLEPEKVLLFDGQGHVVLWAALSKFVRMKMMSGAETDWPWVASRYQLYFPYTGTTMSFELSDVQSNYKGRPNDATYQMPNVQTLSDAGVRVNHIEAPSGK